METLGTLQGRFRAGPTYLSSVGLDLCHWFSVAHLNRGVPGALQLPTFDRSDPLGLLIGNTRALWSPFMRHMRECLGSDPLLPDAALVPSIVARGGRPLDEWVTAQIKSALSLVNCPHALFLGHVMDRAPPPLQRYAEVSGFAPLGRGKLSLHPQHGPWISLRAVVVFDAPFEAAPKATPQSHLAPPCAACPAPCLRAEAQPDDSPLLLSLLSLERRGWIAARRVCPIGKDSIFCDEQLTFHYADRSLIRSS